MKAYLVEKGIPAELIIIDSNGKNTWLTAENTKKILKENNLKTVLIVTQFYHINRTRLAMKMSGVETVFSAHADFFEIRDFYSLIREFFAYYSYLF